jgi:hypothetical protein
MAHYVLLYSGGTMPESEAERAGVMQVWQAWYDELGPDLVDPGLPFTPEARTIASDGTVHDGSVGTMASGYSIIQADSIEEAVILAKDCPVLKGGAEISVYETFAMM